MLRIFALDRTLDWRTVRAFSASMDAGALAVLREMLITERNRFARAHMKVAGRLAVIIGPICGVVAHAYSAWNFAVASPFESFWYGLLLLLMVKTVIELPGLLFLFFLPLGNATRLLQLSNYVIIKVLAPLIPVLGPLLDAAVVFVLIRRAARRSVRKHFRAIVDSGNSLAVMSLGELKKYCAEHALCLPSLPVAK